MADSLTIAVSGMKDAVVRIANAASNLVNASSTGRLPNSPNEKATSYQPTDVVTLSNSTGSNELGVTSTVKPRTPAYTVGYDPSSPDANEDGLVAVPNVDIASELITTKIAQITYKANAAVIRTQENMDKELMETLA